MHQLLQKIESSMGGSVMDSENFPTCGFVDDDGRTLNARPAAGQSQSGSCVTQNPSPQPLHGGFRPGSELETGNIGSNHASQSEALGHVVGLAAAATRVRTAARNTESP